MAKHNFKTVPSEIEFIRFNNKLFSYKQGYFMLNVNQIDEWDLIQDNSLISVENVFFKIYDPVADEEDYYIIRNSFIKIENNKVTIYSDDHFEPLRIDYKFKIKKYDDMLAEFNKKLSYYESKINLGLDFQELIDYNAVRKEKRYYSLISNFNLAEKKVDKNEK
ncbi:hypothetical protein RUS47_03555 [Mycoplasmoides gallisepticum]|uniref:MSC_0621 family F1-like ATPase epsilon subunit n=1 Tax=Mycoplasmoides gallisepticum TaxID=2096 RepID=UPI001244AFA2|nr:hypothetical protein [Mycoplasmoides gallisepticum]QEX47593.1 hypothetical protein F6J63_03625 [Mycoplasmoides gallisepticum]ULH62190.1 hypothetical protein MHC98_03600 [Mycoplasmoides gallisepticum]ULH67529.1 hypothetical protein MHC97_03570 [Mycoplasmoides gallisepticum]ULH68257.1 hypothetical protein MHC99_03595 [Mycoplasmoides gallisepticum]WGG23889.1 hypothetical protein P0D30_03795 [Mycoplasmoides gallisepticum]